MVVNASSFRARFDSSSLDSEHRATDELDRESIVRDLIFESLYGMLSLVVYESSFIAKFDTFSLDPEHRTMDDLDRESIVPDLIF